MIMEICMAPTDARVDAYIEKSPPFAQPILRHLRKLVHKACPGVTETIKWNFPFFVYHGVLCNMSAFRQHCRFGFWHPAMRGTFPGDTTEQTGASHLGLITSLSDLPKDARFIAAVKKAAAINAAGDKPVRKKSRKPAPKIPAILDAALSKNKKARAAFDAFPPSHQREYIEWIVEAKREETRIKRLATAIQWISQGRNWKYE